MPNVIGFDYTLTNKQGELIENSKDKGPLLFLEGSQYILPMLEDAISHLNVGDKKKVNIPASEAYGVRSKELVVDIPKEQFPADTQFTIGDRFKVSEDPQSPVFMVTEVKEASVICDGNHPLAGVDLTFDIEISLKREATPEEVSHQHVHGADGKGGHH